MDRAECPEPGEAGGAVVAMSGGVDSSVAALLVKSRERRLLGVTLRLYPQADTEEMIADAENVARRLGIPHVTLDGVGEFSREVIEKFVDIYRKGETPNPCVDCNRHIKFSLLLKRFLPEGYHTFVTGHYARIERSGDRFLLMKGRDPEKDQSYVLYALTQDILAHIQLPLGDLTKREVRELALEQGFLNAEKRDSQDICFVPDGDYGAFIEGFIGEPLPPGDIIDEEGRVLGRHRGLARYTLGQRRGVGVSFRSPRYITGKSLADNTLTLGPESSLYTRALTADTINIIPWNEIMRPMRVKVKTRYLQAEQDGTVEQTGPDSLRIIFDKPQRAITPGQSAVCYQGDTVVCGGIIAGKA